jgi:hypothetical protein
MQHVLMPIAIIGTFSLGLIYFTTTLTNYFLKKRMVDKGYVDKESVAIIRDNKRENSPLNTLKWALVVFFGGLSLVLLEYIPYETTSPLPYGLFALSISFGLLIHYVVAKKEGKQP